MSVALDSENIEMKETGDVNYENFQNDEIYYDIDNPPPQEQQPHKMQPAPSVSSERKCSSRLPVVAVGLLGLLLLAGITVGVHVFVKVNGTEMEEALLAQLNTLEMKLNVTERHNAALLAQLNTLEMKLNATGRHIAVFVKVNDTETKMDEVLLLDCEEIYNNVSTQSGVYIIYPNATPAKVYCDMDTDGGKWTVIQRRVDGTVNFYRPWAQYKAGFGDASGEYWLGLENMHLLTKNTTYQLRVDMEDFEGNTTFASYSSFSVGSEADGYRLQVAGFQNGGAGDSLAHSNGMKFSTFDKDQDMSVENCASTYSGAFWYNNCHNANPNGIYYLRGQTPHYAKGVVWKYWKGYSYSLKAVAMKIRRVP